MPPHRLLQMFTAASHGRFPPVDGGVSFVAPHRPGVAAVVAFTGHAVIMSALGPAEFDDLEIDGFGQAQQPEVLLRIARGGTVGVLDATLVWLPDRPLTAEPADVERADEFADHQRVRHATSLRDDVAVYAGAHGLITLASGLAGRREMSVEVFTPGEGRGRGLIRAAQHRVGTEPLFAAVSPGNVRSVRAFQAEGFSLICSEVVIEVG